jgi:hypothetical protein
LRREKQDVFARQRTKSNCRVYAARGRERHCQVIPVKDTKIAELVNQKKKEVKAFIESCMETYQQSFRDGFVQLSNKEQELMDMLERFVL